MVRSLVKRLLKYLKGVGYLMMAAVILAVIIGGSIAIGFLISIAGTFAIIAIVLILLALLIKELCASDDDSKKGSSD